MVYVVHLLSNAWYILCINYRTHGIFSAFIIECMVYLVHLLSNAWCI